MIETPARLGERAVSAFIFIFFIFYNSSSLSLYSFIHKEDLACNDWDWLGQRSVGAFWKIHLQLCTAISLPIQKWF